MQLRKLKIKIKNRETPFYGWLHDLYHAAKGLNLRYPRFLARMLYNERCLRLQFWRNFKRLFYYEPMFRSQCNRAGKNLYLIDGIPDLSPGLEINIGDHCTIEGISQFALIDVRNKGVLNIGDHTQIGYKTIIAVSCKVDIGNHVLVGPYVLIRDNDGHPIDPAKRRRDEPMDPQNIKPVVIEDDVWVGSSCIINKGVIVGRGSVIGAGSVVTKDVPPFCVAAGNPARVIKRRSGPEAEFDREEMKEFLFVCGGDD